MRRKVEIVICDICKEEEELKGSHFTICCICKKEVCEGCSSEILPDMPFRIKGLSKIKVCEDCVNENVNKELRRFFNLKENKEQILQVVEKLKQHFVKLAMLNKLNTEPSQSDL